MGNSNKGQVDYDSGKEVASRKGQANSGPA